MENGNGAIQLREKTEQSMSLSSWVAMKEQATMMLKSGFLPTAINTAEKAIAVAMTGRELGIGFMESLRSINVIQGKPTVSPQLMLSLANRTKEVEDIKIDADAKGATVMVKRKGRAAHTESFGITEATAMGLMSKDNYRKQPATMFKWRALAANLRVTFPDAISGLYTPDEMGVEVSESENGEINIVEKTPPALSLAKDVKPQSTKPAYQEQDAIEPETAQEDENRPVYDPIESKKVADELKSRPAPTEISKELQTATFISSEIKKDRKPYQIIETRGREKIWYSTFSETHLKAAEDAGDKPIFIAFKTVVGKNNLQMYRNIVDIRLADQPAQAEGLITPDDWTEIQLLQKSMHLTAEALYAHLQRQYQIDKPRLLPKEKLDELKKWIRGEIL